MAKPAHIGVKTHSDAHSDPSEGLGTLDLEKATATALYAPANSEPPKRKPGRPKGIAKVPGSGRKKGKPNKLTGDVRKYILEEGKVLERLFKIAKGYKCRMSRPDGTTATVIPPLSDQVKVLLGLLDRAVPSLKSQELSGPDDGPIKVHTDTPQNQLEVARRLAFILHRGGLATVIDDNAVNGTDDDEIIDDKIIDAPPIADQTALGTVSLDRVNLGAPLLVTASPSEMVSFGSENFSEISNAVPSINDPPKEGMTRTYTGGPYSVRYDGSVREGLPPIFTILKQGFGEVKHGGWEIVSKHLRRLVGDNPPSFEDTETEQKVPKFPRRDEIPFSQGRRRW